MLRERPPKPFAWRLRIDERIEEDSAVPVGQSERLMLRDRPSGGVCKRRHAEIHQLASFKLRRPLNQGFRGLLDAKLESLFPKPPIALCCRSHLYLQPQKVRQTDQLFKVALARARPAEPAAYPRGAIHSATAQPMFSVNPPGLDRA